MTDSPNPSPEAVLPDFGRQHFNTFQQWVNKASSWLTSHPDWHQERYRAVCFDAKGRLCRQGSDFMRARDDGAFPVYWVWPDQIADYFGALLATPVQQEPGDVATD